MDDTAFQKSAFQQNAFQIRLSQVIDWTLSLKAPGRRLLLVPRFVALLAAARRWYLTRSH